MSLDWNVSKVHNYEEVCWIGDDVHPVTHQLIYATVGAGMPEITEKNVAEFYARVHTMELVHGGQGWISQREDDSEEWVNRFITPEEVRAHIGLRTNASALSRSKFLSSQVAGGMADMIRAFESSVSTSVQAKGAQ